jgi:hypothetical protein
MNDKGSPFQNRLALIAFTLIAISIFVYYAGGVGGRLASESNAVKALTTEGFSHVKLVDRHVYLVQFQGCGKSDSARFDFTATNPVGREVSVSVCEGWLFKGATIRIS